MIGAKPYNQAAFDLDLEVSGYSRFAYIWCTIALNLRDQYGGESVLSQNLRRRIILFEIIFEMFSFQGLVIWLPE